MICVGLSAPQEWFTLNPKRHSEQRAYHKKPPKLTERQEQLYGLRAYPGLVSDCDVGAAAEDTEQQSGDGVGFARCQGSTDRIQSAAKQKKSNKKMCVAEESQSSEAKPASMQMEQVAQAVAKLVAEKGSKLETEEPKKKGRARRGGRVQGGGALAHMNKKK